MWRPTATFKTLQARAKILFLIREFFAERNVLEVETPLLSSSTVTDPHVLGIPVAYGQRYLQTSPEYAMKRLLAAGSGPIFQMCKAFRHHDLGTHHLPEFTMLEWYRPGFDHHALMTEIETLLKKILNISHADRISYEHAFLTYVGINPHTANQEDLRQAAKQLTSFMGELPDRNAWLDLLLTHCIEPRIGQDRPVFLYDFPVSQAALAKIRAGSPPVASRFEVYYKGIELANGFHELQDVNEQRKRFEQDITYRADHHLPPVSIDEYFLAALQHGLPDCAGVALGVDRLVMLALDSKTISEVVCFGFE